MNRWMCWGAGLSFLFSAAAVQAGSRTPCLDAATLATSYTKHCKQDFEDLRQFLKSNAVVIDQTKKPASESFAVTCDSGNNAIMPMITSDQSIQDNNEQIESGGAKDLLSAATANLDRVKFDHGIDQIRNLAIAFHSTSQDDVESLVSFAETAAVMDSFAEVSKDCKQ